jgi:hypothetical protein
LASGNFTFLQGAALPDGYIRISHGTQILEEAMYAKTSSPEIVKTAKGGHRRVTLNDIPIVLQFGPRMEEAAAAIRSAALSNELDVYVAIPSENQLMRMTSEILASLIRIHRGLPDTLYRVNPFLSGVARLPDNGELLLKIEDFRAWYEIQRRRHKWPSQRDTMPIAKKLGRPSKQDMARQLVMKAVDEEEWRASDGIAALLKIVLLRGTSCSKGTISRLVRNLFLETGRAEFRIPKRFRHSAK